MFRIIKVDGLGPCQGEAFDIPAGRVTIRGPSEGGKSTIMTAMCLALWGTDATGRPLDVRAIADTGLQKARVELVTAKGTSFARSIDRDRATTRQLTSPGADIAEDFKTEKFWLKHALPAILARELKAGKRKVHAGRLVAVPFAWEELADSAGGGRELRDALDDIAGGTEKLEDVVAALMDDAGEALEDGDPLTPAAAEEARKAAKTWADKAAGAEEACKAAVFDVVSEQLDEGPSVAEVDTARATLVDARSWDDHRTAFNAIESRLLRLDADQLQWDSDVLALGKKPPFSAPVLAEAEGAMRPAVSRLEGYQETLAKVRGKLEAYQDAGLDDAVRSAIEGRLKAYRKHVGKCPECQRRWSKAPDVIAELEQRLAGGVEAETSGTVADINVEITRLLGEIGQAKRNLQRKTAAQRLQQVKKDAATRWQTLRDRLGDRPADATGSVPVSPDLEEPTAEAVESARETIRASERAAGASEGLAGRKKRANRAHKEAERDTRTARARVAHLEALVDAVRRAPSERLRRTLGTLGDTGPVSFKLLNGSDGIEVLIDKRPRRHASRGRSIYADLCFRLALRRALRMTWFPIFVDDAQCWSKGWPDTTEPARDGGRRETPVIWLLTTQDADLVVSGGAP